MCIRDSLLSVVQGCVHVSIAVCIRDSLHGSGCGLSERYGCVHAIDDAELILLSDPVSYTHLHGENRGSIPLRTAFNRSLHGSVFCCADFFLPIINASKKARQFSAGLFLFSDNSFIPVSYTHLLLPRRISMIRSITSHALIRPSCTSRRSISLRRRFWYLRVATSNWKST